MRKGIGGSLAALLLSAAGASACVSGDVDEEKATDTVPAGITPESATFHIESRHEGAQQALVVRMSSISLCERSAVPLDHPFVEVELAIPAAAQFAPEDCRLDQNLRCRISFARTTTPECASASHLYASAGHVKLDEVTDDVVRGSFDGTNPDSKVDLHGTFVAHRCAGSSSCP